MFDTQGEHKNQRSSTGNPLLTDRLMKAVKEKMAQEAKRKVDFLNTKQ